MRRQTPKSFVHAIHKLSLPDWWFPVELLCPPWTPPQAGQAISCDPVNSNLRRGVPKQRERGVGVRGKDDRVILIHCPRLRYTRRLAFPPLRA